jgi:hypothetical protein
MRIRHAIRMFKTRLSIGYLPSITIEKHEEVKYRRLFLTDNLLSRDDTHLRQYGDRIQPVI